MSTNPNLEYRTIIKDSGDPGYVNRILVGTAATGLVRIEWLQARIGQIIPVNWSWVQMYHFMNGFVAYRYQVDDAQNVIAKHAIENNFQWLLLYEHDVIPPADALVKLNKYLSKAIAPVVSGLYFTRSHPSEPLIFRGRGNGAFEEFTIGEKVYADGVPTGFLLIHVPLLKLMWMDAPEYQIGNMTLRKLFYTPRDMWEDPETQMWNTTSGTSDLEWCDRVIKGNYLRKSGWNKFMDELPDKRYPFVVDTSIFCQHINPDGEQFPGSQINLVLVPEQQASPELPQTLGVNIMENVDAGEKLE